ncbi:hypothetical protein AN963_26665 [Brevibacillus choshinensis]|uniref:Uncharacterized protein n=1 Tax=Brevibacillus choshinensis TaxID=54911 RepID=A0ABR5N350_BRECH|nr:hypothetical protein AN963_26665 [Brevibacillus choshinensis]
MRDQDTTGLTVQRDQLEKVREMVSYFESNHAGTYELHVKDRGKSIDNRPQVTAQWESIIYERDNRVRAVSDATLLFILERVSWREWNIIEVEILSPIQEK